MEDSPLTVQWPEGVQAMIRCDGCGKVQPMVFYAQGDRNFHKPDSWFMRCDEEGAQIACSRQCIDTVAKKTGKTAVVIPI